MSATFVAIRALHLAATMLAFGELAFATLIASSRSPAVPAAGARCRTVMVVGCALAVSALTAMLWLVSEAAQMSGTTLGSGLGIDTIVTVVGQTAFGHVFALRVAFLVAIVALLAWVQRMHRGAASQRALHVALVMAALYLAAPALAGHAAAAGDGIVRIVHVGGDALHLVAAGAWLGALPALVRGLSMPSSSAAVVSMARRFSVLGIVCVAVLVMSGIVNALFLVGSFAALFGTRYGQLLVVKLALFAALLAIAAINRFWMTPRLASDPRAQRELRRNSLLEIALGLVIVAIVGALGTLAPGAHQSPVWPFPFALEFSSRSLSAREPYLVTILLYALLAVAVIIVGVRGRALRTWIGGSVALLGLACVSASLFAVPAFPTTYATSPVPYSVDVVARGGARFASDCSSCHGADARGNGPLAASLQVKPKNLVEHALHHPPGNLFWWIAHGIPGTPMPAFSPQRSDREIWEIVQFVVARASAQAAMTIGPGVDTQAIVRVPDFPYELPGDGQHTLAGEREPALIVLYSASSAARLAQLADDHRLMHAGLRVIPMPMPGARMHAGEDHAHAIVDADVPALYAQFAELRGGTRPQHAELLVDASGIIRARWIGIPGESADRDASIAAALAELPAASKSAPMHHGH